MNPSFRFSFFLATGALWKIVPLKVSATESNRTSSLPRYFRNHGRSLSGTEKTKMPVRDVVQLLLDGKRDQVPVLLPAGRAEPGLAGEPDEDVVVAFQAFRNPVPVLQLAAFERLLHVLDDRRPCQLRRVLLLEILPAFLDDVPDADLSALSPRLEGVAESAYEIGQGVASGVSRNQKPLTELAFLVVGLLCEVRMRITAPLHDDMLASAYRKRLARGLATR